MTTKEILLLNKTAIGRQDRTVLADSIDDGEVFADWNKDGVFVKIRFASDTDRVRFEYYGTSHTVLIKPAVGFNEKAFLYPPKYLSDLWESLKVVA